METSLGNGHSRSSSVMCRFRRWDKEKLDLPVSLSLVKHDYDYTIVIIITIAIIPKCKINYNQ